ncbi:MAG: hypothetical protein WAO06_02035 [Tenuifilaceae bacterium]
MRTDHIVGGMFGLADVGQGRGTTPPFLKGNAFFFVSARAAMRFLFRQRRPRKIWMPSYLCETMLQALEGTGTELEFFPVDYDLQITDREWIRRLDRRDIVVLISYFGFAIPEDVCRAIRERGALVLEDASQALLSGHVGRYADYVVFSPRKFLGVPDSGILINQSDRPLGGAEGLIPPPKDWWLKAFTASLLRWEFDRHGGDRHWFALFRQVEDSQPVGDFAASELSQMLLTHAFDYVEIAERRRDNYQFLLAHLKNVALYAHLPDDVVPLGFPIRTNQRNQLRQYLFGQKIFLPIHWDMPDVVPMDFVDSRRLTEAILTLICDQRYTERELAPMVDVVTRHLGRVG